MGIIGWADWFVPTEFGGSGWGAMAGLAELGGLVWIGLGWPSCTDWLAGLSWLGLTKLACLNWLG